MTLWDRAKALVAPQGARAPEIRSGAALMFRSAGAACWSEDGLETYAGRCFARNPVAHRCVRLIAEAAASAPWRVEAAGREDGAHPLARLLADPQPGGASAGAVFESVYAWLVIAGEAFIYAPTLEGRPVALHVLRPDHVRIETGDDGWPLAYLHGMGDEARRFEFDPDTGRWPLLHLKLFNPQGGLRGASPMAAAARAVDIHEAGAAWAKALMDNAARPSGALVFEGREGADRLTPEQFERLKAQLEDAHTGPANAGRPLLLEGGLKWTPMSLSPAEMDYLEARRDAAREIALALGAPPMLLGIPGDNTYANYKEANQAFWSQTVAPLTEKVAREFSRWLGGAFEPEARVRPDWDRVPAMTAQRAALWTQLSEATFLSDAERRSLAGLPPLTQTGEAS